MKEYTTKNIRNIAIFGHQGTGKTSLTESLLFMAKNIHKKGEVERKNTHSDYMVEEQTRLTSLSMSVIPVEHNGYKLNFLDLPGGDEFVGDFYQSLEVIKGAVILIDANKGVEVGTERIWREIKKRNIPTILFINKMDKENVKFEELLNGIIEYFGKNAVPFALPIGKEENFEGFVNIVEQKGYVFDGETLKEAEIFEDKLERVENLRSQILESVAETSEDLLELYLSGEEIPEDQLNEGLKQGIINGELMPILLGSVTKNIGVETLLDMFVNFMPSPGELKEFKGINPKTKEEVSRKTNDEEPFSGYVFKTVADAFLGNVNLIKINSGVLKQGQDILIANKDETKKIQNVFFLRGKNQISSDVFHAGDIFAVAKVDGLETGDTVSDIRNPIIYKPAFDITPVIFVAISPKNKNDEDKISQALQRLNVEDPTFKIVRNPETAQLLVGGQGMNHIQYILDRMKNMFKVEVEVEDQKIVYRETIKKVGVGEGKHRKQSGGAGQFGHVYIRFEPIAEGFEFASEVVGGAVPKGYFPAVEKGLNETFEKGPLAGFPVINIRCVLFDGSYHDVDSNEISFKMAALLAFRNATPNLGATILEPVMQVNVMVKDQYVGDVMGDMNKRRGRVLGMNQDEVGYQTIQAEVPEAEIVKYAIDLKAMTQGSGVFTRQFLRYEEVPNHLITKVIDEHKKQN